MSTSQTSVGAGKAAQKGSQGQDKGVSSPAGQNAQLQTPSQVGQAPQQGETLTKDTSVAKARRRAFDEPTQANLEVLIEAARAEGFAKAEEFRKTEGASRLELAILTAGVRAALGFNASASAIVQEAKRIQNAINRAQEPQA